MPTNIPAPVLSPTGYVIPTTAAINAGVVADINAAFGNNLNPAANTPQGQLATSETAVVADADAQFLLLSNMLDPAYAFGRWQDGIGRIYYLTRIPAESSVASCTCYGATGTVIPIGAQAIDTGGNIWLSTQGGTIPAGGNIVLNFACLITGAIPCPINAVNAIYKSITGWDSITNLTAGTQGNDVESRASFETRRAASVAINAQGTLPAITGNVFALPGVIDVYAIQNVLPVTSGVVATGSISGTTLTITAVSSGTNLTGSISGTTLTVTAISSGSVYGGMWLTGTGVTLGVKIVSQLTGSSGSTGTYSINMTQTISSESLLASWDRVTSGMTLTDGGVNIADSVTIQSLGTGTGGLGTYILGKSNTVSSQSLTISWGGVPLIANSIYVSVYGGVSTDIASAIWTKMSAGCNMNGNTTVSVPDTANGYISPLPTYPVTFEIPTTTSVVFSVNIQNNQQVPSNYSTLVQNAINQSFNGLDGGSRMRQGSWIFASRFYANLLALGSWMQIISVNIGLVTANETSLLMNINQMPVVGAISVTPI